MGEPLAALNVEPVSPERYARLQDAVASQLGLTLSGNSGYLAEKGVEVAYAYDGANLLTLSVLKVPTVFGHQLIPPEAVLGKIHAAILGVS